MAEFKSCGGCNKGWRTREEFLSDAELEVVGYQTSFVALRAGLFLFNHSCGNTLAIEAGEFEDLCEAPMFTQRLTGQEACPRHCLNVCDLERCPEQCECAYVREVLQCVRQRLAAVRGEW